MNINNTFKVVIIIFILSSCNKLTYKSNVKKENNTPTKIVKTEDKVQLLQGIWESIPYYIEHKFGNKDLNLNKYYKVINAKKTLEITLKYHNVNNIFYKICNVGFLNETNKKTIFKNKYKTTDLKNHGKYLVYVDEDNVKNNIFIVDTLKVTENYSIKINGFDRQYGDDFKYGGGDKIIQTTLESSYDEYGYENIAFEGVSSLPFSVFVFMKNQSKKKQRDYIKEFNIKKFSSKIKVVADKTYFYNDENLIEKRKAFLVKGDIAYLENVGIDNVQVYFDGKVVTGGYLKKNDVQILE